MKLLKLDDESLQAVFRTESGMDFAIVKGFSTAVPLHSVLVVRGNGYAAPIEQHEGIYTVADMVEGHPLPRADADVWMIALSNIVPVTKLTSVSLPRGYLPARGAHALLGSITLAYNTRFFRFTSGPTDLKYSGRTLDNDTYLTTANDRQFVNSGFGAVGRYALPMPVPASWLHDYTIPAHTVLLVGTVAPQFGQAGGGVEVKTVSPVSGVVLNGSTQIDNC